jgi:proteasome accessory factor B
MANKRTQLYSRPPMERMMQIHQRIKSGGYPNSTHLARQLEVTARTIKRDVEFMKDRLTLPIEYDPRRYGYYYSQPVDQFPSLPMNESEVFAMMIADKAVAQYHGTPWHKPLEAAFKSLAGQLNQEASYSLGDLDAAFSFRPLAPEDADLKMFETLTQGLKDRRALQFLYRNLGSRQANTRRVLPYHLACIDNHWYLFALDEDRKAMRTFVVSRMKNVVLRRKRFPKPTAKQFDPDEYLKGCFTVFKGRDDYEVVLEFDAWATDLIRNRRWHASQEFTELRNGCSRLRFRLNNIEEMERFVLSFGTHATVVRPEELVIRMQKTTTTLAKRYA